MVYEFDVAVIGAGPGGYAAAIRAAQEGKKACIVERGSFGGTCLNRGCIPTKALIKGANVYEEVRNAEAFGVAGVSKEEIAVDMKKLQSRKNGIVRQLSQGVKGLLRANQVAVIEGSARFVDEHTVAVGDKKITADSFIVATGSKASIPGFIRQEGVNHVVTSDELLSIEELPRRIVMIGGGVIGIEFAYLLNRLGVQVTVVELMDHILPMVDREIGELARARLTRDGVAFYLGAKVQKIENDQVFFALGGKTVAVEGDMVLVAVGRAPNTEGLGAEEIGLELEKGAVKTDACLRTVRPNIYAIGDVNGKSMLAHTAFGEAETAVDCICGREREMDYRRIPSCIYLEPELACVGLTEEQAREQYGDGIKVGRFPLQANGKTLIGGERDGMFKLIADARYGEILGAHLYGPHATEMISCVTLAMQAEATAEELIRMIWPHPTVSEALGETVRSAWTGKAIHWMG